MDGGTTVSGTMLVANKAGIKVRNIYSWTTAKVFFSWTNNLITGFFMILCHTASDEHCQDSFF